MKGEYLLKKLEGNLELLNMISVERLKKLDIHYDDVIKENDEKIERLLFFDDIKNDN